MKGTQVDIDRSRGPIQKEADNAALCIGLMGMVVTLGGYYCYARGKASARLQLGDIPLTSTDSAHLPADDVGDADDSPDPAGDE